MATVVLCGGGTAGHVIPNLALLPELSKYFNKIVYLGGDGIERELVSKTEIPFYQTTVIKFDRSNFSSNIKIPFLLKKGIKEALTIFDKIQPNVVFSKGGYAALPACFAAKKKAIPVVCHESDYSMGLANKIVSSFASASLTSFPETKGGIFIGNPVRKEIYKKQSTVSIPFPVDPNKKIILVFGGSLGSSFLNSLVYQTLPELIKRYNIIHVCGKTGDFSIKKQDYFQIPYSFDLPALLQKCDLVVCRAGANTLFEVAALGKRCITIPLPKGTSRGDQILNARSFEKRGYCKVLLQDSLNPDTLLSTIEAIWYKTPPILDVLQINEKIVKSILSVL